MSRILKYRFIIFLAKLFGAPHYSYAWYEGALRIAKEDYRRDDDIRRRTVGKCGPFKILEYDTYYHILFHDRHHTIQPK